LRTLGWTDAALDDFDSQIAYIAADNPHAATSVAERILSAADGLCFMPTGRRGRVSGTYEKVITGAPYILAYTVEDDHGDGRILILHVIHTARNWPEETWPG
jgi:plasmid stabilization system protein ParE